MIGSLIISIIYRIVGERITFETEAGYKAFIYVWRFLYYFMMLNIGLGVFNLIPFPPLDGSKVLASVLPDPLYSKWMRYERYGQFVLILVLYLGLLNTPLSFLRSQVFNGFRIFTDWIVGV